MELKGILESFVGCLLAMWVGPVAMAGLAMVFTRLAQRIRDREFARAVRMERSISHHQRRNPGRPGKTWFIHPSHGPEFHEHEGGNDGLYV